MAAEQPMEVDIPPPKDDEAPAQTGEAMVVDGASPVPAQPAEEQAAQPPAQDSQQQQPDQPAEPQQPPEQEQPSPPAEPAPPKLTPQELFPAYAHLPAAADFGLKPGAYTAREEYLQQQELEGNIKFCYVENDGQPHNMIYLIGLKNIFSKQLPNMPKEYICRLVMDRRHKSVALVKKNGVVVGGITYRCFYEQRFGEIAFCAITASEQVKGFGTRLMNYTKEFAVHRDYLTHFLTYADNNAVGYFTKQGFTKEVTLAKDRWYGWIKDYDGGTLMECVMHPAVHYAQFPQLISAQKAALEARIRTFSKSHVVHKGLFQQGAKRQQVPIANIPGVLDAGWSEERYPPPRYKLLLGGQRQDANPDTLHKFMQKLLQEIEKHEDSWPFREPVSRLDVPDYYEVIKDPVDLSLINQRLKSNNYYLTLDIFIADFRRMLNNCRIYNSAETIYFKIANKLEAFLDGWLHHHLLYHTD